MTKHKDIVLIGVLNKSQSRANKADKSPRIAATCEQCKRTIWISGDNLQSAKLYQKSTGCKFFMICIDCAIKKII